MDPLETWMGYFDGIVSRRIASIATSDHIATAHPSVVAAGRLTIDLDDGTKIIVDPIKSDKHMMLLIEGQFQQLGLDIIFYVDRLLVTNERSYVAQQLLPQGLDIDPRQFAPRYVWVDEDGAQVSPVHKNFSTALNFFQGWHKRWANLEKQFGPYTPEIAKKFERAYSPMTRSGKSPAALRRVQITVDVLDLQDDEASVAAAMARLEA